MVFSGDRSRGASGPTSAGPASQRRSLVLRGQRSADRRLQGRSVAVNHGQSVRHGSEQRTRGQLSPVGSRGGGGTRDSPYWTGQATPGSNHSYRTFCTASRRLAGKNFDEKDTSTLPQEDSLRSSSNAPARFARVTYGRVSVPRLTSFGAAEPLRAASPPSRMLGYTSPFSDWAQSPRRKSDPVG